MLPCKKLEPNDLERVIATLQAVYDICQQSRFICEKKNQDCHDVLKPWPAKKVQGHSKHEEESMKQVGVASSQQKELPSEEKLDLTLVEKALAKAERARNKFKIQEKDPSGNVGKERPKSVKSFAGSTKLLASKPKDKQLHEDSSVRHQHKAVVSSTISQSQLNNVLHTNKPGAVTTTGHGLAKTRYTLAHVKAPFKTEPQFKGRRSVIQVKPADKSVQIDNVLESRNDAHTGVNPNLSSSERSTIDNKHSHFSVMDDDSNQRGAMEKTSDIVQVKKKVENRIDNEHEIDEHQKNERFCLLKQGRQLSMPSKYNRLLMENKRLQDKLTLLNPSSSSSSSSVNLDTFMKRLHHMINTDSSDEAVSLRQVLSLTNAYYALHQLIVQVPLNAITRDNLDWQEVLTYIHKLELVFHGFASLESYFERLTAKCPGNCKLRKIPSINKSVLPKSTLYWIPKDIGSVPKHSLCLKYSSPKQLLTYMNLLHQIQVLMLEKHILYQMEDIVDKFSNATGKESWFVPVYRALYGMMCSSGRSFPTIVSDTIDSCDEEEDEVNSNDSKI